MWIDINTKLPNNGESVLLKLQDGQVHEGHFIVNATKYQMNVNRWRIYKPTYKKTIAFEEVIAWQYLPVENKLTLGEWVEEYDETAPLFLRKRWRCTKCNDWQTYGKPKFCPNCGAEMRKENNGK